MPLNWMPGVGELPIDTILLFEERQLMYWPQYGHRHQFAAVLRAHLHIEWFARHKAPELSAWINEVMSEYEAQGPSKADLRSAERALMVAMEDWVVYVTDPDIYQNQSFVGWDERELTELCDFTGKTVMDIGSGTGKQAFAVTPLAKTVFCVEPVTNLRKYLRQKAKDEGLSNVYVVDGLLEAIPFPRDFCDVVMGGHVFGDMLELELSELERVVKPGGMIILCPGNNDHDDEKHAFLTAHGFEWASFLEPGDGMKRKYWKVV